MPAQVRPTSAVCFGKLGIGNAPYFFMLQKNDYSS